MTRVESIQHRACRPWRAPSIEERLCLGPATRGEPRKLSRTERVSALCRAVASREGGFTLIELLIVIGIMGVLLVLIAPAFTYIKGGTDVTSAAYTIKGVLDTARTYAKANNTYTWVGFYEEDASGASTNPATPGIGRLVMSIVASKDGTRGYDVTNPSNPAWTNYSSGANFVAVTKLQYLDNIHLATT